MLSLPDFILYILQSAWCLGGDTGLVMLRVVFRDRSGEAKLINGWVSYHRPCAPRTLPALLHPLPSTRQLLLLNKQRAQPVPWVLEQGFHWGPSLCFCFGLPKLSHPCHPPKGDKDLRVPIAWRSGLVNLPNKFRTRWHFCPERVEMEKRFLFLLSKFILLTFHHRILPFLSECCQCTGRTYVIFWYTVVFRTATKN